MQSTVRPASACFQNAHQAQNAVRDEGILARGEPPPTKPPNDNRPSVGLSSEVARDRLRKNGPNVLPQPERRRRWTIVLHILREPMLLLLLVATGVYMLLGDPQEAALLAGSVLLVIGLTVYQEQKSERALQALRDLSSPRARVLRDGVVCMIAGAEVVVGDVILVSEGDRIPADTRVTEETDLHVDESMLTGESVTVRKGVSRNTDTDALLHASTLVVRGHGVGEVVATGAQTAVGVIGVAMRGLHPEVTPLQREMWRVVILFSILALASSALVTGLYIATRGGWLDGLLAGITLAMSTIPEEFPIILTVFLALGAWRMAAHKALVRRPPAIEALGAITVLCTDKTGTLTENQMAVDGLIFEANQGDAHTHDPTLLRLLETAALACAPRSLDPMDNALKATTLRGQQPEDATRHTRIYIREYPLTTKSPAVAHAWSDAKGGFLVACKGAPETVADLCQLTDAQRRDIVTDVDAMGRLGRRVLGVAVASWAGQVETLPASMQGFDFTWRGLVSFSDPVRAGVPEAVAEARAAGIRVIMLTGDHMETARAIAAQADIGIGREVSLGSDLDALDDEGVTRLLAQCDVFARVRPEHKLRLVDGLKRTGHVVAMTGDGVNDAPALMAAHVGVAMGGRGTDVAREASAIVLLDDNFVTVIRAIRIGRSIYDNIKCAVRYVLAVHVPVTGLALLPLLTGGPLVLLPLHVVFIQLIIDPVCSIVFEREAPAEDIMKRPPRAAIQRMLGWRSMFASLAQGGVMFGGVAGVYAIGNASTLPASQVGALAFTALVMGNLCLILLYRTGTSLWDTINQPNPSFWVIALLAITVLTAITRMDIPAGWFGFSVPPIGLWSLALLLPLAATAAIGMARKIGRAANRG